MFAINVCSVERRVDTVINYIRIKKEEG